MSFVVSYVWKRFMPVREMTANHSLERTPKGRTALHAQNPRRLSGPLNSTVRRPSRERGVLIEPVAMNRSPGRNQPCWCGSGKKFKKCHLGRALATPLPDEAVRAAGRSNWEEKRCLHPQAAPGLCTKIVSAHTVSRSGVLTRILDNKNRVRTFYRAAFDSTTEPEVRSIGWRTSSTS